MMIILVIYNYYLIYIFRGSINLQLKNCHFLFSSLRVVFDGELAHFSGFGLASSLFSLRLMSGDVISLAVSVGITGQGGRIGSVFGGGGLLVTPIPESKHQKNHNNLYKYSLGYKKINNYRT